MRWWFCWWISTGGGVSGVVEVEGGEGTLLEGFGEGGVGVEELGCGGRGGVVGGYRVEEGLEGTFKRV